MEWTHHYINANNIRIHYVEQGTGPLVVLMHGFPEFWYSWRYQIPALAKAGFRVVALDMRGYNETDSPKGVKNYYPEIIATDIKELVHALGEEQAFIVGHDWGGGIAWRVAQDHPEIVKKLVVMNCPIPQILAQHLLKNFRQLRRSWYMFFFQIPWLPEKGMSKDLGGTFAKAFRGWAHNKEVFTREDINEYVKAFDRPGGLTGPMNYYRATFRRIFDKETRQVPVFSTDTLLIWGEDDRALGKELTYDMEQYFTGSFEVRYIKDCSHWVQVDCYQQVNDILIPFLKNEQTT